MSEASMHDLAARLARGEEAAFAELYDACADRLHHYLAVRLGSHDSASDVLQATFLRVVKSRKRFRHVENPVAYLFQIARNEAARLGKRRRANVGPLPFEDLFALAADAGENADDAEVIAAALARLSEDDRELVELKVFVELTFREIADVMGMPQGTVATRYRRALESLRPWLEKQMR
ncbi:MAG TPA: RNA polymerase sigma factor [Lacipirellulaceae bacterium]|nr:RNA polymerase sigma factor [Lacipirellulaceae bacterium]